MLGQTHVVLSGTHRDVAFDGDVRFEVAVSNKALGCDQSLARFDAVGDGGE